MVDMKPNPYVDDIDLVSIQHTMDDLIRPQIYPEIQALDATFAATAEPVSFQDKDRLSYHKIKEGQKWAHSYFECAWFHLQGSVPEGVDLKDLYLAFDCSGEAELYDEKGNALKGFTNGTTVYEDNLLQSKRYYPLAGLVKNGRINAYFDCGANDIFGRYIYTGKYLLGGIAKRNNEIFDIFYDIQILFDYLKAAGKSSPYYQPIFAGLKKVRSLYLYEDPDAYRKAKAITQPLLAIPSANCFRATCVGHAHLDLIWLWPLRESYRKEIRTISNAVYLLDSYPSFTYVCSQPQQVEWLKEKAPSLFAKFKHYVDEGRIELVGGSWVESDTNLIGEEAFMRQMLYGQKFWKENFGHYTEVMWLPDTFGYNGNIPQILRESGQKYFVTIKISWNQYNLFPYHSFVWEGIDGSRVLAHMPPDNSYNSYALPNTLIKMEKNSTEKAIYPAAVMSYGIGDGGGGPDEGAVERLSRMANALDLPHAEFGHVSSFFAGLEKVESKLPVYQGEMYLENHQGTYTSQALNKQKNRHFEEKLRVVEMLLAENGMKDYDEEMKRIWKEILLYQFHDCLPGSSIRRVYEECQVRYAALEKELDQIIKAVWPSYAPTYQPGDYVRNFLAYPAETIQKTTRGYALLSLPANGASKEARLYSGKEVAFARDIETKVFALKFAKEGYLTSIIDRRDGKELLNGFGNKLRVYLDKGDAWNILDSYRDQPEILLHLDSRKATTYGPLYEIVSHYSFQHSKVKETILIKDDEDLIRFRHEVDWKDTGYLLKGCFALQDKPAEVTSDIAFGHLKRSTLNDTAVHQAQYEISCLKWFDLSTEKRGVAFFNQTRDGFYCKEGEAEISLLRSTDFPCTHSDQWPISYSYALYSHDQPFEKSEVDRKAYLFNAPFLCGKKAPKLGKSFALDNSDIEVSCFKNAYEGSDLVMRLYERGGVAATASLTLPEGYSKAYLSNTLEDLREPIDVRHLTFKPFQVRTLILSKD